MSVPIIRGKFKCPWINYILYKQKYIHQYACPASVPFSATGT